MSDLENILMQRLKCLEILKKKRGFIIPSNGMMTKIWDTVSISYTNFLENVNQ